jgi:hypothetical protein
MPKLIAYDVAKASLPPRAGVVTAAGSVPSTE